MALELGYQQGRDGVSGDAIKAKATVGYVYESDWLDLLYKEFFCLWLELIFIKSIPIFVHHMANLTTQLSLCQFH